MDNSQIRWMHELQEKYAAGVCHEFLLYLNINDVVLKGGELKQLKTFLVESAPFDSAKIVAFYNRGTGLRFASDEMDELFFKVIQSLTGLEEENYKLWKNSLPRVLGWFNEILRKPLKDPRIQEALNNSPKRRQKTPRKNQPLIAIVFEFAETLVPADAPSSSEDQDRNNYVIFKDWARDMDIRESRNLIVLVADSLASIAAPLRETASGILPLKILFPDLKERREVIELIRRKYLLRDGDVPNEHLAYLTAGLPAVTIQEMIQEVQYYERPLTSQIVFQKKKKILEEQSGGLIEIKKPIWGMKAIGALKPVKTFIEKVVDALKSDDPLAVPMGILLVGPPGTGKTVFAEALAYEADIPLVILKSIREEWVGRSERNLELAFELIRALAPVIVFQDEIDQQVQARGTVYHGDTGVSARLSARQFEFMSDTSLRGKVVWLAATNRPDLMDPAMLRPGRFDEKIPFLPPKETAERQDIILALLEKMKVKAETENRVFNFDITPEEAFQIAEKLCMYYDKKSGQFKKEKPKHTPEGFEIVPYTGAEIEVILNKAYRIRKEMKEKVLRAEHVEKVVGEILLGQDFLRQRELVELTLQIIDSNEFLSEEYRKQANDLRNKPKKDDVSAYQ